METAANNTSVPKGLLDAVAVSAKSGKNGCNLQGMSWMISLGYIPVYTEEIQAKGMGPDSSYSHLHRSLLSRGPNEANTISGALCGDGDSS